MISFRTPPAIHVVSLCDFAAFPPRPETYISPLSVLHPQHRHTFSGQPEMTSGLCPPRDLDPDLAAINRRDFELPAQCRARHGNGHSTMQIRAVALEKFVRVKSPGKYRGRPAAHPASRRRRCRLAGWAAWRPLYFPRGCTARIFPARRRGFALSSADFHVERRARRGI